ncbi:MFS transporter [Rickettsiales endosymbiont of Trichoplax sp. H2]|uniref:MFS transporter n=1 Tax=Rickettsiales endosymbiont of Trichoplax sp. H2 TaxID=2021221 RepID=UPI0012B2A660|nr:MFS transporter [Rickettsiales endosymbiont of Trichoplax sp. H2]MSO14368.1 Proline/betaine transporter [Rickettsiales endosymbiont of Trichoplax sp. H2]
MKSRLNIMTNSISLSSSEKEAIGLLSIGTFLEYFDLMLYVHMSVLLNDLFFPQSNPLIAKLLGAAAFCSTFILRPFGGFVIGWIGDKIGRKSTIMITTSLMAISCITIAFTGTYKEIGITASIIIILCRMSQGFSSLGEVIGASLYLSEIMVSPKKHFACGIIGLFSQIGGFLSLIIAFFALTVNLNWRLAFLFGAGIAIIGLMARIRLRETPDFIKLQRKINNKQINTLKNTNKSNDKINFKSLVYCMASIIIIPASIYVIYVYFNEIMKQNFSLSTEEIIEHNIKISFITIILSGVVAFLTKKFHPIKITIFFLSVFAILLVFTPYLIANTSNLLIILLLQVLFFFPAITLSGTLELSTWFSYFPVMKRFRLIATSYGIATAFSFLVTSFGLIYFSKYIGYYSLWVIFVPMLIGYSYSISHLKQLEIKNGLYNKYPNNEKHIKNKNFHNNLENKNYKFNKNFEPL